ncbi:hypothetical protein O3P69_005944 [Scylla paramamosain]|uniref:Uncharacterized protein n=1 Tax=Scylla paramamosain TaxID=85552 RepID=A0AAW0U441_SCYPA
MVTPVPSRLRQDCSTLGSTTATTRTVSWSPPTAACPSLKERGHALKELKHVKEQPLCGAAAAATLLPEDSCTTPPARPEAATRPLPPIPVPRRSTGRTQSAVGLYATGDLGPSTRARHTSHGAPRTAPHPQPGHQRLPRQMEPLLRLGVVQQKEGVPRGRHARHHAAHTALHARAGRKLVVQQLSKTPGGVRVSLCHLLSVATGRPVLRRLTLTRSGCECPGK